MKKNVLALQKLSAKTHGGGGGGGGSEPVSNLSLAACGSEHQSVLSAALCGG